MTERIDNKALFNFNFNASFCRFAYQYRWQRYHARQSTTAEVESFPKYPEARDIFVPPSNSRDDVVLSRLYDKTKRVLDSINVQSIHQNLSENEKQCIREMRQLPLTFLPSDKGTEFCVVEDPRYT